MNTSPALALAALAVLALSSPILLAAQQELPLRPGQLVRVIARPAESPPKVGTVVAVRAGEIVLRVEQFGPHRRVYTRDVTVPLDSLRSLEVSIGRQGHVAAGVGIGMGIGAATFGLGFAAVSHGSSGLNRMMTAYAAAVGAVAGGLVGGLLGAAAATERWANIPLTGARISLVVVPGGGPGLGASFRF